MENKNSIVEIFGIRIENITNDEFLNLISDGITCGRKMTIAYANADSLNKIYENEFLKNIYRSFDIIHPDGIGVYIASKILYGKNGLQARITGSDFYERLISESVKNNWSCFFFGHKKVILDEIQKSNPLLKISGTEEGYNYESDKIIGKINSAKPDIIIIGLSCPMQENWIFQNKEKINGGILFAVGDGIKVFAGKKLRGPVFIRKMGFEWFVRLINYPIKHFKKYVTGIPKFIYRILKETVKSVKLK
ncbi:MAG: WecB/TagA/CpsF family glycosyltransferase [Ignavibacteria bacterium]|nr:WecB/TagA/CpsF family glycosyltransferase [Ignavibacteria bacterium]